MGKYLCLIFLAVLTGCASSLPVINIPDGKKKVMTYSSDKEYALSRAYKIANKYCYQKKQEAVVLDEQVKYQGVLEEDINKSVKTIRDVVWSAGQTTAAQTIGALSGDKDYEVTVEFMCE